MRATSVLRTILSQQQTRVTSFEFTETKLIIDVAPTTRKPRCSGCGRLRDRYDARWRSWRHLDFAGMRVLLRYRIRRVDCPTCGVKTELVPWAAHDSNFTRDFEDTVAMLAQTTDKTTVSKMMGVAWRTVGEIVRRVVDRRLPEDMLEGLTHIGIDEISYRKHHNYVTVVTDHERGRVVWVGPGKNAETLHDFFDQLGEERAAKLEMVSIDMSKAYIAAIAERAPEAQIVFDRFHVQRLVHDALDEVRRQQVRELRGTDEAKAVKNSRWALQKNPWNLTQQESEKLADVQRSNYALYRAYLLKESLCDILDGHGPNIARMKLDEWMSWASRSRLAPFVKAARTIRSHLEGIIAYVATRLSNGLSEGLNNKIRTITKRAYGFHDASALMAYIRLCCSGVVIPPIRHFPAIAA